MRWPRVLRRRSYPQVAAKIPGKHLKPRRLSIGKRKPWKPGERKTGTRKPESFEEAVKRISRDLKIKTPAEIGSVVDLISVADKAAYTPEQSEETAKYWGVLAQAVTEIMGPKQRVRAMSYWLRALNAAQRAENRQMERQIIQMAQNAGVKLREE